MNTDGLLGFFAAHRDRGVPLAMVTVYETQGSTYSKAGARMLIDADGVFTACCRVVVWRVISR